MVGDGRLLLAAPLDKFRDVHGLFQEQEHEFDASWVTQCPQELLVSRRKHIINISYDKN